LTKHNTKSSEAERDRPTGKPSEFGEGYDSVVSSYRESLKRINDTLVLEGLSLTEAYKKGFLRIAVKFRSNIGVNAKGGCLMAVWQLDVNVANSSPGGTATFVENLEFLDRHCSVRANQAMMLVSNVEAMDSVNFIPVNLVRLYLIEDKPKHISAREGVCFLSVAGGFRVLPRVAERELCVSIDAAVIGLNERTISVVKGSAKIVDSIPDDCWRMSRNPASERPVFPFLRIGLKARGFDVIHHVSPHNRFELVDVMVGPFYF
jgi:hypothetical protein